jgi:hypothetical protein
MKKIIIVLTSLTIITSPLLANYSTTGKTTAEQKKEAEKNEHLEEMMRTYQGE